MRYKEKIPVVTFESFINYAVKVKKVLTDNRSNKNVYSEKLNQEFTLNFN